MSDRTPVTVITGFLGSGKTTLLNHLLQDPALADAAVIVNEFGEIALDHLLVARQAESVALLASGCICCEMRGDLVGTLRDLHLKRRDGALPPFGRILVETTGLADPVPILQTLLTDAELAPLFRLDSVVTLVDAVHGASQLAAHPEALKQAALADRLLLTKTDLAPPGAAALVEQLRRINPGADVFTATRGSVEPGMVLAAGVEDAVRSAAIDRWLNAGRYAETAGQHPDHARHEHEHRHAAGEIDAFCLFYDKPVTFPGLTVWLNLLAALRGAKLLRVKGLLNVEGKPVVVHAVQTLIDEPVTLERWPDAERRSRLVFITRGMARADIERTLPGLGYAGATASSAAGFDAEAYARFLEVVKHFR